MIKISDKALEYCEEHGIYEIYSEKGNVITYYSYFGEGFYKVTKNLENGKETRKHLRFKRTPKYLRTKDGAVLYNYYVG